jgi:sugar phosphate isomerase/epimerase
LADHRTVGSGIIDYAPVLAGLARHGFDGILLLELGEADFPTALQASLAHLGRELDLLAQSGPAVSPATNHTEANYA